MKFLLLFFMLISNQLIAQPIAKIDEKLNLIYAITNGWEGKLDYYQPKSNTKLPLMIYIHGGGWTHGNKEAEYDKFKVFLANGYAVANIEYRLANQAAAPAAIVDVNMAINYLIKNAKDLNFDKSKVVVMGGSAGAHLALLAGLQSQNKIYKSKKFKVAAIISKYGPTDLLTWKPATAPGSASATWLANRKNDTVFVKTLSPVNYVSNNKIPVLFIHGDQDKTVPVEQSMTLFELLKKQGSPTEIYIVKGGKHGNFGDVETPKMDSVMIGFLSKFLKK